MVVGTAQRLGGRVCCLQHTSAPVGWGRWTGLSPHPQCGSKAWITQGVGRAGLPSPMDPARGKAGRGCHGEEGMGLAWAAWAHLAGIEVGLDGDFGLAWRHRKQGED